MRARLNGCTSATCMTSLGFELSGPLVGTYRLFNLKLEQVS